MSRLTVPVDGGSAPHVLFVADRAFLDRFAPMIRHLGLALSAIDVLVTLITDDEEFTRELDATPIEAHRVPALLGWRSLWLGAEIMARVETPPGLVHLWGAAALPTISRWCADLGLPLVVHTFAERDVQRIERSAPRVNYMLLAASEALRATLQRRVPTPPSGVHLVIPACLAPDDQEAEPQTHENLGVLCLDPMDEPAAALLLLDAIALARARGVQLQAALLGSGAGQRRVWHAARKLRVDECTSFVDAPRLWTRVLAGIDALVVPTHAERMHLAPLSAMSLGKLVIASRDQRADWFIDHVTARLFAPDSAAELADALGFAAQASPQRDALRSSARAYIRSTHAVTRTAERLCGLYRGIARHPRLEEWGTA